MSFAIKACLLLYFRYSFFVPLFLTLQSAIWQPIFRCGSPQNLMKKISKDPVWEDACWIVSTGHFITIIIIMIITILLLWCAGLIICLLLNRDIPHCPQALAYVLSYRWWGSFATQDFGEWLNFAQLLSWVRCEVRQPLLFWIKKEGLEDNAFITTDHSEWVMI